MLPIFRQSCGIAVKKYGFGGAVSQMNPVSHNQVRGLILFGLGDRPKENVMALKNFARACDRMGCDDFPSVRRVSKLLFLNSKSV